MGTTKRAPAKSAKNGTSAVTPGPNKFTTIRAILAKQAAALAETLAEYTAAVQTHPSSAPYPQDAMAVKFILDGVGSAMGAAQGALTTALLTHRAAGGEFEVGKVAVSFPVNEGRRSVSWKDEAVKQAKHAAGLDHGMRTVLEPEKRAAVLEAAMQYAFDEKGYANRLLEAAPRGESTTSPRLTEGV